jgi:hypothetical protein
LFVSMDKSTISSMMGGHSGEVRLRSELISGSDNSTLNSTQIVNALSQSLCNNINEIQDVSYASSIDLVCAIYKESIPISHVVGPYPFQPNGCFGRCGSGCIGDPGGPGGLAQNDLNIFTQNCFNHDACVDALSDANPCCVAMFALTIDDFYNGTDCTPVLIVTINPQEAIDAGAKWQVEGDPYNTGWHSSGDKIDWLPENTYRIIFSDIAGWNTPSPQTVSIKSGMIATTSGTYTVLPGAATLIGPSGTINTAVPTYTWNAVSSATWYYLWVNENGGNVVKQWYTASDAGCAGGTGICSVTPNVALAAGSAIWWIQTWNSNGYGPWSDSMGFTVPEGLPGKATLVSPSGVINTNTPTYTWNAVSSSTFYYLWVEDSTGGAIKQWYTASDAGCAGGTGTCSVTPATAVAAGSDKWWIQTWNAVGYGPWSTGMAFTAPVPPPPGKATLVSPSGTIINNWSAYAWNADAHSTWYLLWVDDSTGNKIKQWYTAAQTGCPAGTGICSIASETALAAGSAKWWIQTWNSGGYGPWSDNMAFTVPAPVFSGKATLVSPLGTVTGTAPIYTWNVDANSTWYYLWVDDSTGNKIKQWYTAAQAGCSSGAGTCSVTPGVALAAGSAKWWVQTWNPNGLGPWSDGMAFSVP